MDLRDSPSEAAFRAQARAFLEAHGPERLADIWSEAVSEAELLRQHVAWQRTLHAHGWAAITWPTAHGGRGLGPIEQIIWNSERARAGLGESLFVVGIGMAGPTIIAHGSTAQKERYLAPMLRAEE
ncbi:MAG TPA: acyl-CoA dehydrogenase family protein, partial [Longimicrobiales bacterium]|nr:acyl-CoA dehydrogenase family protein [Longimicrobiales bacterium]